MVSRRICSSPGMMPACVALTAIGGGIAMATGVDKLPPEWLESTPCRPRRHCQCASRSSEDEGY